jgi:hypothetical protein
MRICAVAAYRRRQHSLCQMALKTLRGQPNALSGRTEALWRSPFFGQETLWRSLFLQAGM